MAKTIICQPEIFTLVKIVFIFLHEIVSVRVLDALIQDYRDDSIGGSHMYLVLAIVEIGDQIFRRQALPKVFVW